MEDRASSRDGDWIQERTYLPLPGPRGNTLSSFVASSFLHIALHLRPLDPRELLFPPKVFFPAFNKMQVYGAECHVDKAVVMEDPGPTRVQQRGAKTGQNEQVIRSSAPVARNRSSQSSPKMPPKAAGPSHPFFSTLFAEAVAQHFDPGTWLSLNTSTTSEPKPAYRIPWIANDRGSSRFRVEAACNRGELKYPWKPDLAPSASACET